VNKIKLTNDLIISIGNDFYGKSKTFRKGKIGNWRTVFTNKDSKVFDKNDSNLMKSLGYN
jgi:hypothetical protein